MTCEVVLIRFYRIAEVLYIIVKCFVDDSEILLDNFEMLSNDFF